MIGDLDGGLRVLAIGAWLVLLAQFVSAPIRTGLRAPFVLLSLATTAAMLAGGGLMIAASDAEAWIVLVAAFAPFASWLAILRLLDQPPERRTALVAALVIVFALLLAQLVAGAEISSFYAVRILSALLALDILRAAFVGRAHDPSPARRALRPWLGALAALQAGAPALAEMIAGTAAIAPPLSFAQAALTLALALLLALGLFAPIGALHEDGAD